MPRPAHKPPVKNWLIEAAHRMLQNNLGPDATRDPDNLIVYGGRRERLLRATPWPGAGAGAKRRVAMRSEISFSELSQKRGWANPLWVGPL